MTYFEARRIKKLFEEYRRLALAYWGAVSPIDYGGNRWMAEPGAPTHDETDVSRALRQTLMRLEPDAISCASRLGVSVTGVSYAAPMIGGPVVPVNFLACVVDQTAGHSHVSKDRVLDAIDNCIGAATFVESRARGRVLKPWCWLVDIPALVVGWPFEVMRRAGVPEKHVEGNAAQVIKATLIGLFYVILIALTAYRLGVGAAMEEAVKRMGSH